MILQRKASEEERLAHLFLNHYFMRFDPMLNRMLGEYSPLELVRALKNGEIGYLDEDRKSILMNADPNEMTLLFQECRSNRIYYIASVESRFPASLRNIDMPPLALFCRGEPEILSSRRMVAIIGSRKASKYSIKVAETLAGELAKLGYVIVSGFARGIDTAAHRGALMKSGKTVAVLGSGILYDYPRNTMRFKEDISGWGAVISEYNNYEPSHQSLFRPRNRLISGLCQAVIVVQAGIRSGCHNTVSHALEQGKTVFAVPPHDIYDFDYEGNKSLLMDGAIPAYSAKQIDSILRDEYEHTHAGE